MKRAARLYYNPWTRGMLVLAMLAAALLAIWWRGPEWRNVYHAFDFVQWRWVVVGVLPQPPLGARPGDLVARDNPPGAAGATTPIPPRLLGLRCRVAGKRRPAGPSGRARTRRCPAPPPAPRAGNERHAARHGVLAPAVRPLPGLAARSLRAPDGSNPALGGDEPHHLRPCRDRLPHRRPSRRRPGPGPRRHGQPRRLLAMARQGLAVLRAPVPAVVARLPERRLDTAALRRVGGDRGVQPEPAVAGGRARPRAHERRDHLPSWPGNIGLLQAAVALPLRRYGVAYGTGFAYGIVLQAVEMSVGVGVGLIFLAREGLSFAALRSIEERRRPPRTRSSADEPDAEPSAPDQVDAAVDHLDG